MATFEKGNMWTAWKVTDLFLITTNSTIKKNKGLVMGRGIAKEATQKHPSIALTLGKYILENYGHLGEYGLLVSPEWPKRKIGLFQVKTHFFNHAQLPLIEKSTQALIDFCKTHPGIRVDLNFPGIGNGRLNKDVVLPIIQNLPDNVHIWEKK